MLTLILFVGAAVLPAIFLMSYIYRNDKAEKEPGGLLVRLVLMGALAGVIAGSLNAIGENILSNFFETDSIPYILCLAFLVVGVVEEGLKFLFLYKNTWNNPNFNYRFDGVVYAVFTSLGFAALENVTYIFTYGLSIALSRAVLSVPAHMGFAVFMGSFYGRAKVCQAGGNRAGTTGNLVRAYLTAIFLHGFYDSCAMIQTTLSTVLFWIFVVVMYIVVIRRVRKESAADQPIYNGFPWGN